MRRVGVRCQAPSPLPPGALECPVPVQAPAAVPGVLGRSGVGGSPCPCPPSAGRAARGAQREGTAVAVGTMARRGTSPKMRGAQYRLGGGAWERWHGHRPSVGTRGHGLEQRRVAASHSPARLQHPWEVAPGGTWGLGNPPGCGGFAFPLIGDVNLGRLSARGAGRRHQLCRAARAAFLIKQPVRRGGGAGARQARRPRGTGSASPRCCPPRSADRAGPFPMNPPPHPCPANPIHPLCHRKGHGGARPGDAI